MDNLRITIKSDKEDNLPEWDGEGLSVFPPITDESFNMPLTVKDVLSEFEAELAYFRTTSVKQHKTDSLRRLEQNVQLLTNYVNSLKEDI